LVASPKHDNILGLSCSLGAAEHAFADHKIAEARDIVDIHPHDRAIFRAPRRMQDSGGAGTNFDTIAIALSVLGVLVGAAGYMVQAWTGYMEHAEGRAERGGPGFSQAMGNPDEAAPRAGLRA
jgi:hypothetical protein